MAPRLQLLRSVTPGSRPAGRLYGEPYFNLGDNQFGVFDSSNVVRDLLGVPIFSASTTYTAGAVVNYQGLLYVANVAIIAAAFNAAQWTPVQPAVAPQSTNLHNGQLVESHAANAATYAIKTLAGTDPSPTNPVQVRFLDGSLLRITAALSITIPSAATLGVSTANLPFRLWFAIMNNAGTPLLAVRQCTILNIPTLSVVGFNPLGVSGATSPVGNSAQVTYSSITVGLIPYRIIGRASYDSGLATVGTWTVSPTRIVLGDSPLPGQVVGEIYSTNHTQSSTTSTTMIFSNIQAAWTLLSVENPIRVQAGFDIELAATSAAVYSIHQLARNPGLVILMAGDGPYSDSASGVLMNTVVYDVWDYPGNAANPAWGVRFGMGVVGGTVYVPISNDWIRVQEIMG